MPEPLIVTEPGELLAYLFASFPEVKKTKVRQWLKFDSVMVNGRPISKYNHPLKPKDKVSIRPEREARSEKLLPRGMKVPYEDNALLVVDKPDGLLSIASKAEKTETAYYYLTDYVRRGIPSNRERVWIVHRLDKETSGLMIFAKTADMKLALQGNWRNFEKRYQAVVEGSMPADKGVLISYLDETNPFRVFSVKERGPIRPPERKTWRDEDEEFDGDEPETEEARVSIARKAVTHYRVLRRGQGRTLVELTLETGRRHQIRVQLADIGCPIIGDEKYEAKTNPAKRLGLHSCSIRFQHPETGKELSFQSALPRNLAKLV